MIYIPIYSNSSSPPNNSTHSNKSTKTLKATTSDINPTKELLVAIPPTPYKNSPPFLQTRRHPPSRRLPLRINLNDRRARNTTRHIDARRRRAQHDIDLARIDGGDPIDLVVCITVRDAHGDERLRQAGEEDGVDLRRGRHVVGFLRRAEGALEGYWGGVGSRTKEAGLVVGLVA